MSQSKKTIRHSANTKIPKTKSDGYTPFPIRLLQLEISAARSSPIIAMAAAIHVSDILHRCALISDDAWNQVKGNTQALITAGLFDTVASSLSTLVEAGEGVSGIVSQNRGSGSTDPSEITGEDMLNAAQAGAAAKILSKGALP